MTVAMVVFAFATPAHAKVCVEPYGELVAVSDVETVVRIKPECAEFAARVETKASDPPVFASALVIEGQAETLARPRISLPVPDELAVHLPRPRKRVTSCSDPAVCGRTRVAKVRRPFKCEHGRGYAVNVADNLTEVRILDACRHMMNPAGPTVTATVPHVLAPDWELDTSPQPKVRRRARGGKPQPEDTRMPPATSGTPKTSAGVAPPELRSQPGFQVWAGIGDKVARRTPTARGRTDRIV